MGAGLLAVKSGIILFIKNYQFPLLQGSIKLFPRTIWAREFLFWYKKTVMPKKKYIVPRNLKNCLPNLPLETGRAKKKISFFIETF